MATNNAINLKSAGVPTYDGAGTFTASTLTQYSVLTGGASNAINSLGTMTDGQLVIGKTGAFQPVLATLTAGTGISVANGAGTITINSVGGGLTWTDVTGTTQTLAVNNAYTANNAGLVTFTLPATAVYGSMFQVQGKGVGGWSIVENAGQTIHFGSSNTTTTSGSLSSTNQWDGVTLVCTTADTDFAVVASIGNLTVV